MPWTRDPSGRSQSQQKSEFQRTTDRVTPAQFRQALAPGLISLVGSAGLEPATRPL
jgi:hypothetical protein